jgi:hypothetical protein
MRFSNVVVALTAVLAVSAQTPAPTPPATTSDQCPAPANVTAHFLASAAFGVRAPRGELSLVPVEDEAARERGLMCVVRIPPGKGMIFVFEPPDRAQSFWMKNTLVALDMVFVTAAGLVTSVAADVPPTRSGTPDDAVARRSGFGRFVIELGGGDAARHGIAAGTKLGLPALSARQ